MGLVGSIAAEPPLPQKTAPKRQHEKRGRAHYLSAASLLTAHAKTISRFSFELSNFYCFSVRAARIHRLKVIIIQ